MFFCFVSFKFGIFIQWRCLRGPCLSPVFLALRLVLGGTVALPVVVVKKQTFSLFVKKQCFSLSVKKRCFNLVIKKQCFNLVLRSFSWS